ncbi:MAG: 30S ribosomal protein S3 [Candidatus Omnitrophica bacterium]|nr:30S ribosomal protein S3 [Candidatus Omnitrophota bacterium]
MGHKVSPKIFRIGLSEDWNSHWFARGGNYSDYLKEDTAIREYLNDKLKEAGLEKVVIERSPDNINITIHSSKPGLVIGRGGAAIEEIKKHIEKKIIRKNLFKRDKKGDSSALPNARGRAGRIKLQINIKEVNRPQLSAPIVAQNIASELEKRIPYRQAMKRSLEAALKAGVEGIKVICSGRLDGVEIARKETMATGKIPLHTLRADIDYGQATAFTTYGAVGVKVWIYKGEVFK